MTQNEYLDKLLVTYSLVTTLSDKNGCRVLRLRHKSLGKDVTLRLLPDASRVYEKLCSVKCPNLPEIYDAVPLDDGTAVLEEYIDGINVGEIMETGLYKYKGAAEVLRGVCSALTVLHSRSIVHRDVKPENVLVTPSGRVVLIDFNASRVHSLGKKDTVIMGTVGYAPPEQLGMAQSDDRTDVYAAGVLLNVMLTGAHPTEVLADGRAGRIVKKCTMVNPDDRFQSAEDLANAL